MNIYKVFVDSFSALEINAKRGRSDSTLFQTLLNVLQAILKYLKEGYIRKGWQLRSIAGVLEKTLYWGNRYAHRKFAFQLLLDFLQTLDEAYEGQADILAGAIPLEPFILQFGGASIKLPTPLLQPNQKAGLVSPSNTPSSCAESVEMLAILMDFIGKSGLSKFSFWFDLVKTQYFSLFFSQSGLVYPSHEPSSSSPSSPSSPSSLSSSSSISPPSARSAGFLGFPHCPHDIMDVIVTSLAEWLANESISHVIWTNEENHKLLFEIYLQSLRLPVAHHKTTKKSIQTFRRVWLDTPSPPELSPEQLTDHRKFFLNRLSIIFQTEADASTVQDLLRLCLDVVQLFKFLFAEAYESLDDGTRDTLLQTLITSTSGLLGENSNNLVLANQELLSPVILDTLLFIWIRTRTTDPNHWQALRDGFGALLHREETIDCFTKNLIQLTMVIGRMIYPARFVKAAARPKLVTDTWGTAGTSGAAPQEKKILPSRSPDFLPPPTLPPPDASIDKMNWTLESVVYCWNEMLQILRNVNAIKSPKIHHMAIQSINEICAVLLHFEDSAPHAALVDEQGFRREIPKPLELINTFGPWLFAACALPDKFVAGKADAFAGLCRLILRHSPAGLPQKLLSHFYSVLHLGLTQPSSNSLVQHSIIIHSSNIFNLGLPGVNVLIPYFLMEIRKILENAGSSFLHKKKCLLILSSLLCQCRPFSEIPITTDLDNKQRTEFTKERIITMSEISLELIALFRLVLQSASPHSELLVHSLWSLSVTIVDELSSPSTAKSALVADLITQIQSHASSPNPEVARAAIDSLSSVANNVGGLLCHYDMTLVQQLIRDLAVEVKSRFESKPKSPAQEATIASYFYCILDWVTACPKELILHNPVILQAVCGALELGLLGQKLDSAALSSATVAPSRDPKSERSTTSRIFGIRGRGEDQPITHGELTIPELLELLRLNPFHESKTIQYASEEVLLNLAHYFGVFPFLEGIEIDCSQVTESDDLNLASGEEPRTLHYVFSDCVILSLIEVPKQSGEGSFARIILRDAVGKFAWDTDLTFDQLGAQPLPTLPLVHLKRTGSEISLNPPPGIDQAASADEASPSSSDAPLPNESKSGSSSAYKGVSKAPRFSKRSGPIDKLSEMLQYLTGAFPDCLPEYGLPLDEPAPTLNAYESSVAQTMQALVAQQAALDSNLAHRSLPPSQVWQIEPPAVAVPVSKYHHCRLLLTHLGLLQYEKRDQISILETGTKLRRELGQLDITPSRETCKIGVVLVREGQDDQIDLLKNENADGLYLEFIRGLGWPIDTATHRGYLGGLDPKGSTGKSAPYWANISTEILFHETTSMPTSDSDPNQIHIKRHIGNDNVNIVYSEHLRDYDPHTIRTEFNDSIIVVYPLSSGLFRIQIYQKETIPIFGPLIHGMVIPKHLLPSLVRQTALNANRYWRSTMEGYTRAYVNRRNAMTQAVQRFKQVMPYSQFMSHILQFGTK